MKANARKELKSLSQADLQKQLGEERERVRVLQFDLAAGKVKNIREIRSAKKKIAAILTFLKLMTK
ncbi:MAG: 50S ribosomal protein L29 [Patescibacteria group bacterium]